MATLLINSTNGAEHPEKATLPFILANNAAIAGQDAIVLLATRGGAVGVHHEGLPPVGEIIGELIENGGQVWACQSCTGPRGITQDDLVDGARIGTSIEVVELLTQGAASLTF
jgi:predicted peroxiredoxin